MKNKLMSFILFIIMLILIFILIVFGIYIYEDIYGIENQNFLYKIDGIFAEEPVESQNVSKNFENLFLSESIISSDSYSEETKQNSEAERINNFFYNQLTNTQKKIYDGLYNNKDNLKKGNYVINYDNQFSDILSEEDGSKDLQVDYQTAVEAFIHDNVDVFYIDFNKMYLNIEKITKLLKTSYKVYISPGSNSNYFADNFISFIEIENIQKQVEMIKNDVINSLHGNEYQNILYIHDYLINNIEYDSTYSKDGSYSIYGALVGKTCVCEGYAKAFKYLANSAGYKCEIMKGTATNSSGATESHAWNCIELNHTWYIVDLTWDDPIIIGRKADISNEIKYRYFLKGMDTFNKDHFLEYQFSQGGHVFTYPIISKKDY